MTHTAKHTPGPWNVRHYRVAPTNCQWSDVTDSTGGLITHVPSSKGNAALIAAAPAMYEALAKLRLEAIHYRNTGVGVQFLNHAIDQAELAINQVWGEGESNYDTEREG